MLVDKLPDVANLGVGALVFGQFLGERTFSRSMALIGLGLWFLLIGVALWLARREDR
ncbi:MAG: hypothetical protein HY047_11050 [Acidobacteria bacterium]|nr:hypothetical protein [Acidobacteriota bacterium]